MSKPTSGELAILKHGVAARLHIPASRVRIQYFSSLYPCTPEGIRDESECVRCTVGVYGAQVSYDGPLTFMAEKLSAAISYRTKDAAQV